MLDRNSTTIGAAAIGSASRSAASLEGGMRHLRPKLTYANVISTLCLFLLLGGGAYAATELSPNSVGAKQLRRHAVIPSKLSRATVKKLHRAVGARGPKGDKGDAGPAGPSDTYIAGSAGAKLTKTSKEVVSITVPAGSYLLGPKLPSSQTAPTKRAPASARSPARAPPKAVTATSSRLRPSAARTQTPTSRYPAPPALHPSRRSSSLAVPQKGRWLPRTPGFGRSRSAPYRACRYQLTKSDSMLLS